MPIYPYPTTSSSSSQAPNAPHHYSQGNSGLARGSNTTYDLTNPNPRILFPTNNSTSDLAQLINNLSPYEPTSDNPEILGTIVNQFLSVFTNGQIPCSTDKIENLLKHLIGRLKSDESLPNESESLDIIGILFRLVHQLLPISYSQDKSEILLEKLIERLGSNQHSRYESESLNIIISLFSIAHPQLNTPYNRDKSKTLLEKLIGHLEPNQSGDNASNSLNIIVRLFQIVHPDLSISYTNNQKSTLLGKLIKHLKPNQIPLNEPDHLSTIVSLFPTVHENSPISYTDDEKNTLLGKLIKHLKPNQIPPNEPNHLNIIVSLFPTVHGNSPISYTDDEKNTLLGKLITHLKPDEIPSNESQFLNTIVMLFPMVHPRLPILYDNKKKSLLLGKLITHLRPHQDSFEESHLVSLLKSAYPKPSVSYDLEETKKYDEKMQDLKGFPHDLVRWKHTYIPKSILESCDDHTKLCDAFQNFIDTTKETLSSINDSEFNTIKTNILNRINTMTDERWDREPHKKIQILKISIQTFVTNFEIFQIQFETGQLELHNNKVDNYILEILGRKYAKRNARLIQSIRRCEPEFASLVIYAHLLLHIQSSKAHDFLKEWNDLREQCHLTSKIDLAKVEEYLEERVAYTLPLVQKQLEKEFPDVYEKVKDYFDELDSSKKSSCCSKTVPCCSKIVSCCKRIRPWWNGKPATIKDAMLIGGLGFVNALFVKKEAGWTSFSVLGSYAFTAIMVIPCLVESVLSCRSKKRRQIQPSY
ncbi:MAG: hypothetical protein ACOVOR_01800 [Rhabdochlamydiaceae bacterium]